MDSQAPADPYTLHFETVVDAVSGTDVVLDETYFYPEGGGQPADRGSLETDDGSWAVVDVQKTADGVVHRLETEPDLEPALAPGDTVRGQVDPEFRTYCMRAHTASHVLYGAARRLFDDLGYGGFGISAGSAGEQDSEPGGKVRVDLSTPSDVDDEALVELERLTNRAVWDSRAVTWETHPADEALEMAEIAFNTKTEEGITGETVRVVTVSDWDVAACGGTHVRNTREIGPVSVLDRSNPGEGLTRVEFAVGPAAIQRRAAEKQAALGAARDLGTRVEDIDAAVAQLREERDALQTEVSDLREELVTARVAELREEVVEKDGSRWLVGTVAGLDANELADQAGDLAGEAADVAALVSPEGYLAVATTGDVDAGEVVEDVTAEFGGGGGGSATVAQAGGLSADPEDVVAFLR